MSLPHSDPPSLGEYAVHTAREGFASILHQPSGEIMHSRTQPMEEARRVYVDQADLAGRLRSAASSAPLVLWDVGLGAAANAVAALECYEAEAAQVEAGPIRPMHVVSFENDIDSLRLALAHPERFPYLQRSGPAAILHDGRWESDAHPGLTWEVILGDFIATMSRAPAPPEVIFYDMFSPKTCAAAWYAETFQRLYEICGEHEAVLCTYTLSTASRAAMLAAGFWVARGRPAGAKSETTIALTPRAAAHARLAAPLLGAEWLAKWERSTARFPSDVSPAEQPLFAERIRQHPQFHSEAA